jgi:hypothetical protein
VLSSTSNSSVITVTWLQVEVDQIIAFRLTDAKNRLMLADLVTIATIPIAPPPTCYKETINRRQVHVKGLFN